MQNNQSNKSRKIFSFINPDAAGVDIGGSFHFVAVPDGYQQMAYRQTFWFVAGVSSWNKNIWWKKLSSKTKPSANRAAAMLRMLASTLHRSHSALGAFLRRQKARLGAPKAITATAYKIERLIYSMLKNGEDYVDNGENYYDQQYKQRILKNIEKKAKTLGFFLTPIQTTLGEVP